MGFGFDLLRRMRHVGFEADLVFAYIVVIYCCYFTFFKFFFYIDMYLSIYIANGELMGQGQRR